jgi:hypothetical protein
MHALRADPPTARIPVLFFSGLSQANELKLMEEGAAGYFAKSRLAEHPASGEQELIQLIDELVRSARTQAPAAANTNSRKVSAGAL